MLNFDYLKEIKNDKYDTVAGFGISDLYN